MVHQMAALSLLLSYCTHTNANMSENIFYPSQIHLSLSGKDDSGNSDRFIVSWYLPTEFPGDDILLEYGSSPNLSHETKTSTSRSVQYLPLHGWHYKAETNPLTLNSNYYYRIISTDRRIKGTKVFKVKTAPESLNTSFGVSIFGDMGWLGSKERPALFHLPGMVYNWSAVPTHERLNTLINEGHIDLTIIAGDIGYADDAFSQHPFTFDYERIYNGYMDWMQIISSQTPFMTVPGNHESECHSLMCFLYRETYKPLSNFTAYNSRFYMPSKESRGVLSMWYSFNYGGIHFTMINTETDFPGAAEKTRGDSGRLWPAGNFAPNGTYIKWLEYDLREGLKLKLSGQRPWHIVVGHRPSYRLPKEFLSLFKKYKVDIYFSGHIHEYIRTHNYTSGKLLQIVVGSAGCDEMTYVPDILTSKYILTVPKIHTSTPIENKIKNTFKRFSTKASSTGILTYINQTTLRWRLIDSVTGGVLDEVWIKK